MKSKPDPEEQQISDALESGAIEFKDPSPEILAILTSAAGNTFKKDRRINIRLE